MSRFERLENLLELFSAENLLREIVDAMSNAEFDAIADHIEDMSVA
jgi:hypothetical protein